jgi:DNA mismatch endonuclease (patch repair protein)
MAANLARNTKCELRLCAALRRLGFEFRRNVRSLPGKPDIVFTRERLAIFCDGDFWHGRHWHRRKALLAHGSNADYWISKIAANIARDRAQRAALRKQGWRVTRIWETEILKDPERVARRIIDGLK